MLPYQIDDIDRKILSFLVKDARMPYLEIARQCGVSGAAIHQRMRKLEENGVVTGSRMLVKPSAIGLNVCAYVSISLSESTKYPEVIANLKKIPEMKALLPTLRAWRAGRFPLATDDKVLCAWNALMIEALCELYRACGKEIYLTAAKQAQAYLDAHLREGAQLYVSFRAGKKGVRGQLSDYAAEISALLALWGATLEPGYPDLAEALADKASAAFFDGEKGGFYLYDKEGEALILRPKESADGALPGGNAMMLRSLLALQALRPSEAREQVLAKQLRWQAAHARLDPMGHAAFLAALSDRLEEPPQVTAVLGDKADLRALPFRIPPEAALRVIIPPTAEYPLLEGKTTYYVCRGSVCLPPVTELE